MINGRRFGPLCPAFFNQSHVLCHEGATFFYGRVIADRPSRLSVLASRPPTSDRASHLDPDVFIVRSSCPLRV